jgi:hypothetical protein
MWCPYGYHREGEPRLRFTRCGLSQSQRRTKNQQPLDANKHRHQIVPLSTCFLFCSKMARAKKENTYEQPMCRSCD